MPPCLVLKFRLDDSGLWDPSGQQCAGAGVVIHEDGGALFTCEFHSCGRPSHASTQCKVPFPGSPWAWEQERFARDLQCYGRVLLGIRLFPRHSDVQREDLTPRRCFLNGFDESSGVGCPVELGLASADCTLDVHFPWALPCPFGEVLHHEVGLLFARLYSDGCHMCSQVQGSRVARLTQPLPPMAVSRGLSHGVARARGDHCRDTALRAVGLAMATCTDAEPALDAVGVVDVGTPQGAHVLTVQDLLHADTTLERRGAPRFLRPHLLLSRPGAVRWRFLVGCRWLDHSVLALVLRGGGRTHGWVPPLPFRHASPLLVISGLGLATPRRLGLRLRGVVAKVTVGAGLGLGRRPGRWGVPPSWVLLSPFHFPTGRIPRGPCRPLPALRRSRAAPRVRPSTPSLGIGSPDLLRGGVRASGLRCRGLLPRCLSLSMGVARGPPPSFVPCSTVGRGVRRLTRLLLLPPSGSVLP